MKIDILKTLPEEVQDFIWEVVSDVSYAIEDKFSLNFEQSEFLSTLQDDIILQKIDVIDLSKELEKIPGKFGGDLRELALQMAIEIFWPLQDYLGGVDRLILRLGGKVPSPVILHKKQTPDKDYLDAPFQGRVKELIKKHKEFKNLRLTPNKIINKKGRLVNPSVQNWIDDYIHFLGAGQHSSLQRAAYVSKNKNAIKLSNKHKDCLRFLLLSYDEGVEFYFYKSEGLLLVEEYSKKNISSAEERGVSKIDFDKFLDKFKDRLDKLQGRLIPDDMLISESGGDIPKLRDMLWKAIGIGDKDKAISCVRLLIEKRSFDSMIKDDSRFKSILKRFIGIKYGQNMERSLDGNIDKLISRRIFLEMFLVDKLGLVDMDLYAVVYFLTNIVPSSGQLIYLDKNNQKFEWRTIQVLANKFVWVDRI